MTLSSPGAVSTPAAATVAEPNPGYTFTLVNGRRTSIITPTPGYAWFAGGNDEWTGLAVTPSGTIYAGWNDRVYRISPEGVVEHFVGDPQGTTIAHGADGVTTNLGLSRTSPLAWDETGGRLIFGHSSRGLFAVDPATRVVTLIAGGGTADFAALGQELDPFIPRILGLRGVTVTPNGVVWIACSAGLYTLRADGTTLRAAYFAGNPLSNVTSVTPVADGSDEVYASGQTGPGAVFRFRQDGTSVRVAGGGAAVSGTGPALDAQLHASGFVALRGQEVVWVDTQHHDDVSSHRIRQFAPGGDIRTIAGMTDMPGDQGDEGDGLGALLHLPGPAAIWMGHVVFADQDNDAIRVIW
jgi:hypothetical protein